MSAITAVSSNAGPFPLERPELVFAFVGPTGVPLDELAQAVKDQLACFGYRSIDIHLSDLLANFSWDGHEGSSEFDRIRYLQNKGDSFRETLRDGAALARAGLAEIRTRRASITGSPVHPAAGCAYILRQLKHPDEVDLFRTVYGSSFLLVGGHAPRKQLVKVLARRLASKDSAVGHEWEYHGMANEIIDADQKQASDLGQNTRDTYPKADFFANLGIDKGALEVQRFVDLLFGHPSRTPKPDEYAMYQASAAALRSSDDNRQVGAVIVSLTRDDSGKLKSADVITTGMNEVPRGGGGFYWDEDSPDQRDQALLYRGMEPATEIKISVLTELLDRIRKEDWLKDKLRDASASELARGLLPNLKRTQFLNIGEFSRPVHAEMAALIDGARRGVAVNGHTMYVTTFPCHNCAKHIIAAGIRRVVYLEPYPKSRAEILHGEEMILDSEDGREVEGKVVFFAFGGVAPRQYRKLFSMSERGAKKGLSRRQWEESRLTLWPRYVVPNAALAYLAGERQQLEKLPTDIYRWDKEGVRPVASAEGVSNDAERAESGFGQ